MPADRDSETGQFTQEFPIDSFVEAVENLDRPTTARVAESIGCSYDLAYRRLKELEQSGEIIAVEVGNAFLWSIED